MKIKFFIYCPADKKLISQIIDIASKYNAGRYNNYSHVAFITYGYGNWKSEKGSTPYEGKINQMTRSKVAKIEMTGDNKNIHQIASAIKKIHPWEQVDIEFVEIKQI